MMATLLIDVNLCALYIVRKVYAVGRGLQKSESPNASLAHYKTILWILSHFVGFVKMRNSKKYFLNT